MSWQGKFFELSATILLTVLGPACFGQTPPPAKRPPVGPPAPQSTHYPILLLAFGNNPNWSLRIGQKGPERFERPGYPPIALEPAEVTHEAPNVWTYHAKDSATGAVVAVHLTREPCADTTNDPLTQTNILTVQYTFRASVDHAQIGALHGCARIAAELFPKISNQTDADEDDSSKKKPPAPTITNFKSPVAIAYLNPAQQIVFKRGQITRLVSAKSASSLSVSHDGRKLLFTADEAPGPVRALYEYEFDASAKHEVIRANVRNVFWSPDDKKIAFLKWDTSAWSLWTITPGDPQTAASISTLEGLELYGWPDAHIFLGSNHDSLLWIGEDGSIRQQLPFREIFGGAYRLARIDSFRLNPVNPDILLVSFWYVPPASEAPLDKHEGDSPAVLLYEIKSKRRVVLTPPGTWAESAEWSRDGLQIFFTGTDFAKRPATYRIFWDGTGLQKYSPGTHLVIGQ